MDSVIQKATSIELRSDTRTSDAVHQIVDACLEHATANVSLMADQNADAVHQTRVGMRRLRSALSLFKQQLDKDVRQATAHELSVLGKLLGPVRDWDVFVNETLLTLPNTDADESLKNAASSSRASAYSAIRYDEWDKLRSVMGKLLLNGHDLEEPISDTAPDLLARQARKVKRCLRHLDTAEQRHALRKKLKTLRYSVEFLGSLFDQRDAKRYLDHCKDAQERLGKMNDMQTTIRLLQSLNASDDMIVWADRRQVRSVYQVNKIASDLREAKRFW